MTTLTSSICIGFAGDRCVGSGSLSDMAILAKQTLDRGAGTNLQFFDSITSHRVEFDLRGSLADVLARLPVVEDSAAPPAPESEPGPRGPGRPKLGVVAREVTLLPRHWDWLAQQRGGASVTLRRLVDEARHANKDADRIRQAQDAAYRFIAAMADNKPNFEDATRALFAGDAARFAQSTGDWPVDVRDHARALAAAAFAPAA
ncbi:MULTISPECIES: DUF2239 family protein [Rhodopseudomonas]|uniref:DUF2239 family protein n=1 Tax=Rhodopseudomonas palustris TaxID=1076 RepID=A0A0D7EGP9_RHOPL|nr:MULTISPECIES: DUF2239 family protein [Rhodopseudomonas]KIZ40004.1 hypothetical protein OO17_18820 [Rhodopseudomonas palustris]MDF3813890.1 DUF2239 family protein [Rhodopseudomonas sp. BAL398]WOK16764.1 DUF2239 family protein [Rhodopseudomonas sp. BAL398]